MLPANIFNCQKWSDFGDFWKISGIAELLVLAWTVAKGGKTLCIQNKAFSDNRNFFSEERINDLSLCPKS